MCARKMIGVLRAMNRTGAGAATRRVASNAIIVGTRYNTDTATDTATRPAADGQPRSVMNGTVISNGSNRAADDQTINAATPPATYGHGLRATSSSFSAPC